MLSLGKEWKSSLILFDFTLCCVNDMNSMFVFVQQNWCCKDRDGEAYLMVYTLALIHLRYTSFCLEKCLHNNQGQNSADEGQGKIPPPGCDAEGRGAPVCGEGFLDLLFYVFYLPLFFTGPLMTFNSFQTQVDKPIGSQFT